LPHRCCHRNWEDSSSPLMLVRVHFQGPRVWEWFPRNDRCKRRRPHPNTTYWAIAGFFLGLYILFSEDKPRERLPFVWKFWLDWMDFMVRDFPVWRFIGASCVFPRKVNEWKRKGGVSNKKNFSKLPFREKFLVFFNILFSYLEICEGFSIVENIFATKVTPQLAHYHRERWNPHKLAVIYWVCHNGVDKWNRDFRSFRLEKEEYVWDFPSFFGFCWQMV